MNDWRETYIRFPRVRFQKLSTGLDVPQSSLANRFKENIKSGLDVERNQLQTYLMSTLSDGQFSSVLKNVPVMVSSMILSYQ